MNDPWKNARRPSSRPPRATPLPPREGGTPPPPGRGNDELRLYGWNAVQALFAKRPQALRKLYLVESLIPRMQPVLKWRVYVQVHFYWVLPGWWMEKNVQVIGHITRSSERCIQI